jgi:hypothetical protein
MSKGSTNFVVLKPIDDGRSIMIYVNQCFLLYHHTPVKSDDGNIAKCG